MPPPPALPLPPPPLMAPPAAPTATTAALTELCSGRPELHSPARLWRLAARCLLLHPAAVGFVDSVSGGWQLSRYVVLPEDAADQLLNECSRLTAENSSSAAAAAAAAAAADSCLQLLATSRRARLRCCDLRALPVPQLLSASRLLQLMATRPHVLRLDSPVLLEDDEQLAEFQRVAARLRQLWLGHTGSSSSSGGGGGGNGDSVPCVASTGRLVHLNCPRLMSLLLHGSPVTGLLLSAPQITNHLLSGSPRLTHLEISNVYRELDVSCVAAAVPQLRALVLHNVCLASLQPLRQLRQLRYLDLSVPGGRQPRSWPDPDQQLAQLVEALPLLQHLDIACTNLAGSGIHGAGGGGGVGADDGVGGGAADNNDDGSVPVCDIVGLKSRATSPLRYLNIYGCNAAHRLHVPALEIGGELSEQQLLAAAAPHRHHPLMMLELLDQLEALLQMNQLVKQWRAILHLTLDTALSLGQLKDVHIRCAAVVQNVIVSRSVLGQLTEAERQRVLRQAFRSVRMQRRSVRLRHYVVLILMNFDIPRHMLFAFDDYLDTLCSMLQGVITERDNFVERVLIYFLNKTCCDVDDARKELIGARGLIHQLLKAIHARLAESVCDEVMRYLWSCLWNVTDETPANCRLFLDHRGLDLFLGCLHQFRANNVEIVRNMMGLMGNIAEVTHLRPCLFHSECVDIFCQLLEYEAPSGGGAGGGGGCDLEVGYHAGGVLANLLSDGAAAWRQSSRSRLDAAARLHRAVRQWDVHAERTINYRSLRPIVRLLLCSTQPESQLWAVWALTNLTHAVPDRYAPMVRDEGALPLLLAIAERPAPAGDPDRVADRCQDCGQDSDRVSSAVHQYLTQLAQLCRTNVLNVLEYHHQQQQQQQTVESVAAADDVDDDGVEMDAVEVPAVPLHHNPQQQQP